MKNILIVCCTFLLSTIAVAQTTWNEIPTGTDKKLNSIYFPSDNVGYIVGADTTILKTTDGGQTWVALGLNGISISSGDDDFTDVRFISEDAGYLVSGYSGVWKTIDGAQSWTQVGGGMCFPYTVFPFSGVDYIVGGEGCFGGTFIDYFQGSTTGNSVIVDSNWHSWGRVQEISFINSTDGLAATRSEYMLKTVDAGIHWDTISTGLNGGALTSVVMVDDTLCYAGYEDPSSQGFGILTSEDGGLTWYQDVNSATFFYPDYLSVHAADNGDVYSGGVSYLGPGGLIFEKPIGAAWIYGAVEQAINDMTSYGSDITFGVGDSGYLVVNTPVAELGVTSLDPIEFDAYPNPVQNVLTIENPNAEPMGVTILDINGRILIHQTIQSELGEIDCLSLTSGTYFVKVNVGDHVGTKQFVKTN